VFYLDSKRVRTVRHADKHGRWTMHISRSSLSPGKHRVRAQVFFTQRGRKPMSLHFAIRACLNFKVSQVIKTTTPIHSSRCAAQKFRAYVAGDAIRRVVFSLDGRQLKSTRVADWHGRYWVDVDAVALSSGKHTLRARMQFIKAAGKKPRTLTLRFRRCG
jgi:hypothetical protein